MAFKISGNTKHLTPSEERLLQKLFRRRMQPNELVARSFANELYAIASTIRRRVGVFVDREGVVTDVFVGTKEILYLPDLGRYRVAHNRLRRIRLIFSDLSRDAKEVQIPSDIFTDLEKLRLDAVCGVKVDGESIRLAWAHSIPYRPGAETPVVAESFADISQQEIDFAEFIRELEQQLATAGNEIRSDQTAAILVGVYSAGKEVAERSMAELRELARTAGLQIVGEYIQRRKRDPRTLVGKGKLEELVLESLRLGAEMIVFDAELLPSQWRVITNSTELKILDRSMLILDIFAQRATSSDGRLQVELAQLKYNLPRLVEKDAGLSRLAGGIGGRGPGETKLEIGRRRMRDRITALEKQIDVLSKQRGLRRNRRSKKGMPLVAILGYTNAGKSSLFNQLTSSAVLAEDKLFATLDPNQGKLVVPIDWEKSGGRTHLPVVLSDTVGFIKDLPDELMAAFRATLEELGEADLLLHLVDGSDPEALLKAGAVEQILRELDLLETPRLTIINKCDLLSQDQQEALEKELDALSVSAKEKLGFTELKEAIAQRLSDNPSPSYMNF